MIRTGTSSGVGLLPPEQESQPRAGAEGLSDFSWNYEATPPSPAQRLLTTGTNFFVAAVLSPFRALTIGSTQKILLAIVILDIPFQLGKHFFYRENDAALGALGGLGISATTIALLGLYISWVIRALATRRAEALPSFHINVALSIYVAIATLSLMVAQDVTLSLFEVFLLFESYLVYVYVANSVRTREDVSFVARLLLIGGILESLVMIAPRFMEVPPDIFGLPLNLHIDPDALRLLRVGGTIGAPNTGGAYLAFMMACAAGLIFANVSRSLRYLAIGVFGFGGIALVFTYSRGAWLALAVSLITRGLMARRQRRVSVLVLVMAALLWIPFQGVISNRLFGNDNGSAESRIPLMNLAMRIFEDNPVLGVGCNNFSVAMDRYLTSEFRRGFLYAVHNKYLLILCETGIGGLLAYLVFLLGTLRKGWQCGKCRDALLSPLAIGFTAALVGHMVQMNVDIFRGRPIQQLVWLVAGLLTAMHRMNGTHVRSDNFDSVT
jgi:O-antigen ligase